MSLWGLIGAFIVGWMGWFSLTAPVAQRPSELVVIDAAVAHPHILMAHLKPHQHAVILKADAPDSLIELTQILTQYRHLRALHLISHGGRGQLQLGQMGVNTAALVAHGEQLRQWRQAMSPNADILLYGCDVARSDVGLTFLQTLRQFTHADIAASSNLTGSPHLNGDWQLEVHMGQLETPVVLSGDALSDYDAVLKQISVTTTADAGVGSLRWAIAQANVSPDDDLIDLSRVQGAIVLQSPLPAITSNLFLVGNDDDTIRGSGKYRALEVDGGDVTIRNLTLADGLAQGTDGIDGAGGSAGMGGGLLIRRGTVQLSQVEFVNNQASGGSGSQQRPPAQIQIQHEKTRFKANRGAIAGINGASFPTYPLAQTPLTVDISSTKEKMKANRGAIAGVNGIGINGIGAIAFGGGGGFGGFGNAGNGGNGGNAGVNGGNGGNGGDGGNGGVGIFGTIAPRDDQNSIGAIAFGGGGGFGGFGNAGNGGNGGNATTDVADGGHGGNGGNGGNGGFGGGGGAGGSGGAGGISGHTGRTGLGGFGGGDGGVGYSGGGGGLGGAVFIRSGSLILHQVRFIGNAAIAGSGISPGQGKGGALFITSSPMDDQASPEAPSRVLVLGDPPEFIDNIASDAAGVPTDNNDIYGAITHSPSRI